MKKITAIILTTLLLISSALICVSAKSYGFVDNKVLIILTEEATQRVNDGELEINKSYFANSQIGISKLKCSFLSERFACYTLILDKHDHENVLKAIKILEKYDDIESASPVAYKQIPEFYLDKVDVVLKAGQTEKVTLFIVDSWGEPTNKWKSTNEKVATVSKNGKITALREGTAKITTKDTKGRKYTCKVRVTSSPKLIQNKKAVTLVTVKKGKTVKVKITGKAKKIDNRYTNTKYAKITSKKSASTLKIKGLKKGNTTLKIKVNGVKLKLKVKVK